MTTWLAQAEPLHEAFKQFVGLIGPSVAGYLPEIAIVAVIVALLVVDMFMTRAGSKKLAWLALAGVGVAMFLVSRQMGADLGTVGQFGALKDGALVDPMLLESQTSRFFQMLFLIGTAVTIVFSYLSNELADRPMGEYYIVLLSALLGCFVMSEANNLLLIFVAIELLSIPSYVLTGYMKRDRASSEASVKYVIYGSVASGIMLYGFSLIYGMTGSLQLDKMTQLFSLGAATPYAAGVALLLSFVGFAYKLAAVPLHFWAPDVYRGAPTPITAWLAVVSKAAGIIVFLRFMSFVMPGPATELAWGKLLALVAAVTMTLGNLAALQQTSLKRMLAYSSVAHVGYILMGVAAADFGGAGAGWHAVTFYTVAYLAMNLGAFGCVMLAQNKLGSDEISKFAGLGLRAPLISVCLAVCVISLLGLPPTAGFSGKVQLFMSAIAGGMTWLAIVAAINTAISAYYYARVIKVLYFDKSEDATPLRMPLLGEVLVFGHMLAVLYLGVRFGDLLATIQTLTIN